MEKELEQSIIIDTIKTLEGLNKLLKLLVRKKVIEHDEAMQIQMHIESEERRLIDHFKQEGSEIS